MSILSTKPWLRYVLVFGVCVVLDVLSIWRWSAIRGEAALAVDQAIDTAALVQQIEQLRTAAVKQDSAIAADSLAKSIETAATSTGLANDRIVHIAPRPPRQIPDSPYLEQVTEIELREIGFSDLIRFMAAITGNGTHVHIPQLSLRAPPQVALNTSNETEKWNAQLTLTTYAQTTSVTLQAR